MIDRSPALHISKSFTSRVIKLEENSWHLELPAHTKGGYRLAQLDDHNLLRRSNFLWKPPLKLKLRAKVSSSTLPGTWGFGLWNDPFSFLLGNEGFHQRLPSLPDAIWYFHASPQNYLSFRDDLPANGFLAGSFSSTRVPAVLLAIASPILTLSLFSPTSRILRQLMRRVIQQDATQLHTDVTEWHSYEIDWKSNQVKYNLDEVDIFTTDICPHSPLSLVIWIDNQYAALPPKGRLKYGSLSNPEISWLEIKDIELHA